MALPASVKGAVLSPKYVLATHKPCADFVQSNFWSKKYMGLTRSIDALYSKAEFDTINLILYIIYRLSERLKGDHFAVFTFKQD